MIYDTIRRAGVGNSLIVRLFKPGRPEDAAIAVILATTRGIPELYHPPSQLLSLMVLIRHTCPWLMDWLL